MTLRDNRTHGRAKGLWTGKTMHSTEVRLGRKARYWTASEMHVLSLACFGSVHGLQLPIRSEVERGMRTSRLSRLRRPKVVADGQFEAVLGKTRRTEF